MNEVKKFIDNLRIESHASYVPTMRAKTTDLLIELLDKYKPNTVLEIGTCVGVSALTVLNSSNAFLTTIELDEDRHLTAKHNFNKFGFNGRYNAILGNSDEVLGYLDEKFDFIIMDGAKGQYRQTFDLILPLTKKGTVIFIDDVDYHDMLTKDVIPHKHRTIINNMKEFISYIESNYRYDKYDIEDGVLVVTV